MIDFPAHDAKKFGEDQVAELVVRRASAVWQDRYRAYTLYVDGEERGSIKAGSEMHIQVAPGKHACQLRLDWCSSPIFETEVAANETKIVECGPNANPFSSIIFITFLRKRYIWVRAERT
jgi:hypothetical protein